MIYIFKSQTNDEILKIKRAQLPNNPQADNRSAKAKTPPQPQRLHVQRNLEPQEKF